MKIHFVIVVLAAVLLLLCFTSLGTKNNFGIVYSMRFYNYSVLSLSATIGLFILIPLAVYSAISHKTLQEQFLKYLSLTCLFTLANLEQIFYLRKLYLSENLILHWSYNITIFCNISLIFVLLYAVQQKNPVVQHSNILDDID
ncbi:hypothetical protein [Aureispira anguillae]|uniref:Uncharacterized protein n=1 Tax=Aureispira anguillae TaxID=2864201 RepID=A0A915YFF1_9BACT|nr:hypothetical protein [Aureispira anguillae]BDS12155.1 hypothetical protein AsAng_0028700 [Aureispira anguillae]